MYIYYIYDRIKEENQEVKKKKLQISDIYCHETLLRLRETSKYEKNTAMYFIK